MTSDWRPTRRTFVNAFAEIKIAAGVILHLVLRFLFTLIFAIGVVGQMQEFYRNHSNVLLFGFVLINLVFFSEFLKRKNPSIVCLLLVNTGTAVQKHDVEIHCCWNNTVFRHSHPFIPV